MQTFLPYPDYARSAATLHPKHLGKQRVEAMQILMALTGEAPNNGWANHPATLMWAGAEQGLFVYTQEIIYEWVSRGYKDKVCLRKVTEIASRHNLGEGDPAWLSARGFHEGMQSNLVRKKPDHYGPQFPGVPADLEYVWPVRKT